MPPTHTHAEPPSHRHTPAPPPPPKTHTPLTASQSSASAAAAAAGTGAAGASTGATSTACTAAWASSCASATSAGASTAPSGALPAPSSSVAFLAGPFFLVYTTFLPALSAAGALRSMPARGWGRGQGSKGGGRRAGMMLTILAERGTPGSHSTASRTCGGDVSKAQRKMHFMLPAHNSHVHHSAKHNTGHGWTCISPAP